MLAKLWFLLQGKKTYLVAGLAILYALLSVYFHQMDWKQAAYWLYTSGALVGMRSAIAKLINSLNTKS